MHFFYDAQGRAAVVEYNGTVYRYVHNLQGDVVAIIDGSGIPVVEYCYDAWGKPIRKTGIMAETLGTLQPFRYRGYVWDEETGLYFLKSRYYDPGKGKYSNADCLVNCNLYRYCCNNAIHMVDQNGNSSVKYNNDNDLSSNGRLKKSLDDPITNTEFAAAISQMNYEKWKYDKRGGPGMRERYVDCVSVYRYIIKWYYKYYSKIIPHGVDTVKGIVQKCCHDLEPIANDHSNLQIGMALFEKKEKANINIWGIIWGME